MLSGESTPLTISVFSILYILYSMLSYLKVLALFTVSFHSFLLPPYNVMLPTCNVMLVEQLEDWLY